MPPSASSKRPTLRDEAPVNAPFSCPNSSLSIRGGGQGGAVHLDQHAVAPPALGVDRLGHDLLARPRLAEEQHRRVRGRDLFDLKQDAPQRDTLTHDVVQPFSVEASRAEILVFRLDPLAQGLHLGQGGAQLVLVLAPQQGAGEHLADEAEAMKDRLRPRPLPQCGAERHGAKKSISDHDREERHGLHTEGSQRLEIAGGLWRNVAQTGDDHRHALLDELLEDPRADLGNGHTGWKGSHAGSHRDRMGGAQDAVVRVNHSEDRALGVEELGQTIEDIVDARVEVLERPHQQKG